MLVNHASVSIKNVSLPPLCMESTWAGDYDTEDFERYWQDEARKPYIMHWAGIHMNKPRPINRLFYDFLTHSERQEWDQQVSRRYAPKSVRQKYGVFQPTAIRLKRAYDVLVHGKG